MESTEVIDVPAEAVEECVSEFYVWFEGSGNDRAVVSQRISAE